MKSPRRQSHITPEPPPKRGLEAVKDPAFALALMDWFAREGRELPWRQQPAAYAVVVSEFMLQQTQVATVIPYFTAWLERFPDWRSLAGADEQTVLGAWEGLGYYSRARNLHRLAQVVVEVFDGDFPADPAVIRRLPGIGDYTAGAVASFAFNQSEPAVDGNVARVLTRLLDWRAPVDQPATMQTLREVARSLIPEANGRLFNGGLMELGALLCGPRKPLCMLCPVRDFCQAAEPATLPVKQPRRTTVHLTEHCWWVLEGNRLALAPGTGAKRWRGLWRLPDCVEAEAEPLDAEIFPYTHHRIVLQAMAGRRQDLPETVEWVPLEELAAYPMPAPHRRLIHRLLGRSR